MSFNLQIAPLRPTDVSRAAEIQGRAFFTDPAMAFIFADEGERRARLPWLMGMGVGYGMRFGEVLTTADTMLGHAVWLPPGETSVSEERMADLGFGEAPERMGEEALGRFGAFMECMGAHHERLAPEPHWYLMILGVEPGHQGQGIGSALMAPVLSRADGEGLRCYLETANERNLVLYRRHGFEVRAEDHIPGGGPKVWMMVREPRD